VIFAKVLISGHVTIASRSDVQYRARSAALALGVHPDSAMWRVLVCGAASVLAACTNGDCEDARQVVAPSSDTTPGTLQSGTLQSPPRDQRSKTAALATRSDGSVLCVTCTGIVTFDAKLHEIDRTDAVGPIGIAVAPDDAFYAIMRAPEIGTAELVAMSPAGARRWTAQIAAPSNLVKVVAGAEGAYAGAWIASSDIILPSMEVILGFDAQTGAQRTVATGLDLLAVAHSGVLTVDLRDGPMVTLRQLDPAGTVVWSRTIASAPGNLQIGGAVVTPDGRAIVFGSTQWAFATDAISLANITNLALTTQGEIVITSEHQTGGLLFSPDVDAYISVATPDGIVRTLGIDGRGIQSIAGLAAAPDGLAWVQVESSRSSDESPGPLMQIGGRTFSEEGSYLFKLVP
jgi:hypothetical protein